MKSFFERAVHSSNPTTFASHVISIPYWKNLPKLKMVFFRISARLKERFPDASFLFANRLQVTKMCSSWIIFKCKYCCNQNLQLALDFHARKIIAPCERGYLKAAFATKTCSLYSTFMQENSLYLVNEYI